MTYSSDYTYVGSGTKVKFRGVSSGGRYLFDVEDDFGRRTVEVSISSSVGTVSVGDIMRGLAGEGRISTNVSLKRVSYVRDNSNRESYVVTANVSTSGNDERSNFDVAEYIRSIIESFEKKYKRDF